MIRLEPLPHRVHFVCPDPERWKDLFEAQDQGRVVEPPHLHQRIIHNSDSWIVLTYLRLCHRGLDVRLEREIQPGRLCVVSGINLAISHRRVDGFVAACRTDGWDPVIADFAIVHNPDQAVGSDRAYVPTWPQPGLIARDVARGDELVNVVYKGDLKNLHEPFRSDDFRRRLAGLGADLQLEGKSDTGVSWNDYSHADLVIAARDLREREAEVKPASKLVNAWLAGVPAALGPEPAFQGLRESELDYREVRTPDDVLRFVEALRERPRLYRDMVDNGLRRGADFSDDATAARWRQVLAGPVAQAYERWCGTGTVRRRARVLVRAPGHRRAKSRALRVPLQGRRILTGEE